MKTEAVQTVTDVEAKRRREQFTDVAKKQTQSSEVDMENSEKEQFQDRSS